MQISRGKKILLIGSVSFILFLFAILPVIVQWYVERNSEELVGRQIRMHDLDLNFLTGGITVEKPVMLEQDRQTIFFQAEEFYVNLGMLRLLIGQISITEVTLTQPQVFIIQQGPGFNLDDLVTRFTTTDSTSNPPEVSDPLEFRVENISILDGIFSYVNKDLNSEIKVIKLNTNCPLISSDDPREVHDFSFLFDRGGRMAGSLDLNINSLSYRTSYTLDSLNIAIFYPYIADYMRAGKLEGLFTSHQQIAGNFQKPAEIATAGEVKLNAFALTDPKEDRLVALEEAKLVIDSVDVGHELYDIRYASIMKPFLKFELFDQGNNFTKLMKEEPAQGSGISSDSLSKAVVYGNVFALMAAYIREMSRTYAFSEYKADSLVMRGGTLIFNDYTLHSRFNYLLEDLMVKTDHVSSSEANIKVVAASILNTSGRLNGQLLVDPHGFSNMDIDYSITKLKVSDFNPYSDYYVAHPFTDGICTYVSKSSVRNQYLKSNHKLDIKTIKVGKKVKNKTAYNVPVKLAVALLRDKNGDVHLELPIEGNLNDPNYKVGKVIWQVFRNLISKAVAAPGKLLASKAGVEEKLLEGFTWLPLQADLTEPQLASLDALVKSLETTPEMNADLVRMYNDQRELDELALREGKKKFLLHNRRIQSEENHTPEELAAMDALHPNDSAFHAYLNNELNTPGDQLVSVYEKSRKVAGHEKLIGRLQEIYQKREVQVLNYLVTMKGIAPERVKIASPEDKTPIPYATPSRMNIKFFVDDN